MALKFEYNKEERTATVCGVDDKSCEKIIIPATVEYYKKDYKVTSIGKEAFKGCESLKEVTIPDSVTSIGDYVFLRCSSLKAFYGRFASADNRCLIVNGVLNSFAPVGLTK